MALFKIETIEDLKKYSFFRKYIRQLTMYCYGSHYDNGLFIFVNGMGKWKVLEFKLDENEVENILCKLNTVYEFIQRKEREIINTF